MKRLPTVFFLVAGCAVAQTWYTRSNVDPLTQPVEMFPVSSVVPRITAAPNIECDCTMTTVSGDPYQGFVTTSFTFHVVNPVTTFLIGVLVPGGGIANCSEPVSGSASLISRRRLISRRASTLQA